MWTKNIAKDYRHLRKPSNLKDKDQNRQKKGLNGNNDKEGSRRKPKR